jgi:hypothetical protein
MKRNIIISVIGLGLLLSLGCEKLKIGNDFLSKAPGVDVTQDTIFSNIMFAERFLWGAYSCLPYGINLNYTGTTRGTLMQSSCLESLTDINFDYCTWAGAAPYYAGTITAASTDSWLKYGLSDDGAYDCVRRCFIFLANIDRVPGVDPVYVKQLKAEARMLTAFSYAHIYRHYGGMPWLSHAYNVTEPAGQMIRLTARAYVDSITALIDKAMPDLPWAIDNPDVWDGRFTKITGMALKTRLYLFDASPLFNDATPYLDGDASQQFLTWHGGYDKNLWKKAADAAHDLIVHCETTGDFKMYHKAGNSFRKDFQEAYYLRGNGEVLVSLRCYLFRSPTSTSDNNYSFYNTSLSWGMQNPTDNYVRAFGMANGKPITDPTSGYDPANPFFTAAGVAVRDPRLYETVLVNGDAYRGRKAELWVGGQDVARGSYSYAPSSYHIRKFWLDGDAATSLGAIVHWPYIRLPEVYLSFAEADNEFNGGPSAEGYRCVNIVRNRVGLANLPAGLNQVQFREAILTERQCEFGWEENRWFDLIRWEREADFTKRLTGLTITRNAGPPVTFTYAQYNLPLRYWMTNFNRKWWLTAIPLNEISKGYGLVQNPGWE